MNDAARSLVVEITHCPVLADCKAGADSPCSTIVGQQDVALDKQMMPEPWCGHLELAPILFLSSNPNVNDEGLLPWALSEEVRVAMFDGAFDGQLPATIRQDSHLVLANGTAGKSVKYWAWARNRATELMGRTAKGGIDYAMTETVRCESKKQIGVAEAFETCTRRYLDRTLALSPARAIVVVGAWGRKVAIERWGFGPDECIAGPLEVVGRQRYVLFLDHPGGFGHHKKFVTESAELEQLRPVLMAHPDEPFTTELPSLRTRIPAKQL